jgi:hypothetical protein
MLAVALGIVAPVVGVVLLAAVVLPAVATVGDRRRGRRRLALPWRFVRNLADLVAACVPALLVALAGAAAALLIDRADEVTTADDFVAAVAGATAALLALQRAGDRQRFAVGDAVDAWCERAHDGWLYGAWACGLLGLAGSLVLRPDLWPLPG